LYNLLQQHPDVGLSELTEINFFSDDFDKGFDYYSNLFKRNDESIDMTPKYFMLGHTVAPRIKKYVDEYLKQDPEFLLILRNPIDYLNSHYAMQQMQAPKLGGDDKNKYSLLEYIKRNPGYMKRAKYLELLSIWLEYFEINNFKVICFEEFIIDKEKVTKEILEFWELKDIVLEDKKVSQNKLLKYAWLHKIRGVVNKSEGCKKYLKNSKLFNFVFDKFLTKKSGSVLSVDDRLEIGGLLRDDTQNLKDLLGEGFGRWGEFKN
jgi:hypothetical protein